jgi:RNA polymerase sigma-70 factor (ECF subfamily)
MTTPAPNDLERLAVEARAAWPHIEVDAALFEARLAAVLERTDPAQVRGAELYLTMACAAGDGAAIAVLESKYMPSVARAVGRVLRTDVEDLLQELRALLLVGRSQKGPAIARYDGRGGLASWLRIVALREALSHAKKRAPPGTDGDDHLLEDLAAEGDAELDYLRSLYRPQFERAFRAAFDSLEAEERNLLRYVFVEGLDATALGRLLKVHRTTAARQLARIEELVLDRTKQHLLASIDVAPRELESILRLVKSQLGLSLSRLFAGT